MTQSAALQRVEFDSTIEEVVGVQIRLALSTKSFARQRRGQVVWTGLSAGITFPASVLYHLGYVPPAVVALGVVAFSVLLGVALGYLAGRYFDWRVRRAVRRSIVEYNSGSAPIHQEIELRPDGLWCRSRELEMTLPWVHFLRTTDAAEAIELWFSSPALVRVPSRAFLSAEHRREFLQHATMRTARPTTTDAHGD
jgi:hypothetical protein